MKNFKLYSLITLGVTLFSMVLPYQSYDKYAGGLFKASRLIEPHIKETGLELPQSYILLAALLIISLVTLIKENFTTSIIGFILGAFTLLYMPIFAFTLVFTLNFGGGPRNKEIELGFYIATIAVLSYVIVLLLNLIWQARNRRKNKNATVKIKSTEETDLLDDF